MDVLFILAFCVLFGAAIFLCHAFFARRRSEDLQRQAYRLGFSFEPMSHPFQDSNVEGLTVLDGCSTVAHNVLKGTISNANIVVFDIVLCTVSESPVTTTCAAFRAPRAGLPKFQVRMKDAWERLGEAVVKVARLESVERDFAQEFFVQCPDQRRKHDFFTPRRLQHLRACVHDFRIEASPEWLLIYRPGHEVKASELPQFLHATSAVASALLYQEAA